MFARSGVRVSQQGACTPDRINDVSVDVVLADTVEEAGTDHDNEGLGGDAGEDEGDAAGAGVFVDLFEGAEGRGVKHQHV